MTELESLKSELKEAKRTIKFQKGSIGQLMEWIEQQNAKITSANMHNLMDEKTATDFFEKLKREYRSYIDLQEKRLAGMSKVRTAPSPATISDVYDED